LGRRRGRDRRSWPGRGRDRAARARPQGARPPCPDELDGGRARVLVLARARARRRLLPDPSRGAGTPPSCCGRLDRAQGGPAGRGPSRGARPPLPAGARARRGRRRHGGGEAARRAGAAFSRAGRRARARPRCRPGGGAARPRPRARPDRRSRTARAPRPLGGRRRPGRPKSPRSRGRTRGGALREAEARALTKLALVAIRLGESRQAALSAKAVALLEQEPPGPALVAAYTQLAWAAASRGAYAEAIAAADRAHDLAE